MFPRLHSCPLQISLHGMDSLVACLREARLNTASLTSSISVSATVASIELLSDILQRATFVQLAMAGVDDSWLQVEPVLDTLFVLFWLVFFLKVSYI